MTFSKAHFIIQVVLPLATCEPRACEHFPWSTQDIKVFFISSGVFTSKVIMRGSNSEDNCCWILGYISSWPRGVCIVCRDGIHGIASTSVMLPLYPYKGKHN